MKKFRMKITKWIQNSRLIILDCIKTKFIPIIIKLYYEILYT